MQTQLPESVSHSELGEAAQAILRRCVHCGFCNATCPTYQLLGDERDGPRGRIYLVKQWLEGEVAGEVTRDHLHRCLACQSCETTCPSGVEYLDLVTRAKQALPESAKYHGVMQLYRALITWFVPRIAYAAPIFQLLKPVRPLLPRRWRRYVPRTASFKAAAPVTKNDRHVILFKGCAQKCFTPSVNTSASRLLAHTGCNSIMVSGEGCCGALSAHMNDNEAARVMARTNIDAWWPHLQNGAEALVVTATGCSKFLMGYDKLLADDPAYAHKAREVATRVRDITEQLATEVLPEVGDDAPRLAFHAPCSLTHGLKLDQTVADILRRCGFALTDVPDSHLCCGAGGAYMLLHPRISRKLGQNRTSALQSDTPQAIATANIGCQLQLARYSKLPVRHWLEWLAESIPPARK